MYFLACACLIKNMKNFILKVFIFYGMEEPTLKVAFVFYFYFFLSSFWLLDTPLNTHSTILLP